MIEIYDHYGGLCCGAEEIARAGVFVKLEDWLQLQATMVTLLEFIEPYNAAQEKVCSDAAELVGREWP